MVSSLYGSSSVSFLDGYPETSGILDGGAVVFGGGDRSGHWHGAKPERHFLTVSPTRSGKGVYQIIPNLLIYRASVLVIDPKGENAWLTAKHRREQFGQKTFILDPWGEVNRRFGAAAGELETVARFNPLSILDPKSPNYVDDLAYIADALIINEGKEPHWDNSARELVAGLVSFVVEKYAEKATLAQVRLLLSKPVNDLVKVAAMAQAHGSESIAARKLGRFVHFDAKGEPSPSDEMRSVISTALTQTAILDSAALSESMSESSFSFEDLVNGYATVYLVLPVDKLQTYGRWLRLMVSIAIRTIGLNVKPLGAPVLFMLDEFGTIGRLSAIAQAFGLMAGLQMCVWAFLQDLNQLKRDYPDDWETFIANTEYITAFGLMDQFTCEYFSKMLGVETREQITQATAYARRRDPSYATISDTAHQRSVLFPDEVRRLKPTLGLACQRAGNHYFSLVKYYENDRHLLAVRLDPRFPGMAEKIAAMKSAKRKAAELAKYESAKNKFPELGKVKNALKDHGFRIKKKGGFLSKKKAFAVVDPVGRRLQLNGETAFLEWAWAELATFESQPTG